MSPAPPSDLRAIDAQGVQELAWQQDIPALDAEFAARVAAGAARAVASLRSLRAGTLFDTEPGEFLQELERRAEPSGAPAQAQSRSQAARGGSVADLLDGSLVDAAALLAAGEVSSTELTRAALERAHAAQTSLNCFIEIRDERALAQAAAADASRAAGHAAGPLQGVPLAHKDMYYERGLVTRCGSRVRGEFVPDVTATVLARYTDAGAVNLGTLNMTEFALGPTGHNAIWGDVHNPWNTARIACGSSSGSGAAVAARLVFGSLGSDTGGSVRLPASVNGVVGLKPTYGRISRAGSMGLSFSIDTPGPLARTVADCARLAQVAAGFDALDPTSSARAVGDYEAASGAGLARERIGIPRSYFFDALAPDVRRAMDAAIAVFAQAGARLVEVDLPAMDELAELSRVVVYSEASALHGAWLRERPEDYSPQVRVRVSTGLAIPAPAYLEALHMRTRLLREFVAAAFGRCDTLLAPTVAIPVPTLAATGVGGGAAMWDIIAQLVRCTAPFNYLGVPVLSVPAGFTDDGMPTGLQLVGRPFAEARLFRVAGAYEAATQWHRRAPPRR
jgi:aspartyl-tRNA(Asn)/glutamyl-tRNA(Gln) amidotransferase subunit A